MESKLNKSRIKMLKKAVSVSKFYIATTKRLQQNIIKYTEIEKIDIIPNLVDDKFCFFSPPKGYFRFFSLARFDFDKRIDLLIMSFCEAFSEKDDVSLYIGGDGKERRNLEKLIIINKREHQIKMLGRLSREETVENMKKCSCFVLPSRHETFGLVWREALCIGRPVITTDHGGFCSDDWSDDYGIMISVDDQVSLCKALKQIKDNYSNYDLLNISKLNRCIYSSKVVCSKIKGIFQEIKELNK